jgi:hypothetical protein
MKQRRVRIALILDFANSAADCLAAKIADTMLIAPDECHRQLLRLCDKVRCAHGQFDCTVLFAPLPPSLVPAPLHRLPPMK